MDDRKLCIPQERKVTDTQGRKAGVNPDWVRLETSGCSSVRAQLARYRNNVSTSVYFTCMSFTYITSLC